MYCKQLNVLQDESDVSTNEIKRSYGVSLLVVKQLGNINSGKRISSLQYDLDKHKLTYHNSILIMRINSSKYEKHKLNEPDMPVIENE